MYKEIVVFDTHSSPQSGYVFLADRKKLRLSSKLISYLLALPLIIILYIATPLIIGEIRYRVVVEKQPEIARSKFSYVLSPNENEMELIIPKIAVRTKVLTNIDPNKEEEYNAVLTNKAAHAQGSSYPGQKGLIYLFGHSTNSIFNLNFFNPVFYSVKNLEINDELTLLYQGKLYNYRIDDKKIVEADDLSNLQTEPDKEKLILQTCWPPGTSWKRLLLIASPIT